jgi:hypothetical protein
MPTLLSMFERDNDQHQPLLAALSNTIIHSPGGNPLLSSNETQSTLLIRLGDYLNILRHNNLQQAMNLEREMIKLDTKFIHKNWRNAIIEKYRHFNNQFPENFKIKCKTTKVTLPNNEIINKPEEDSFLCMLDYFRNILVHLPLPGKLIIALT